MQTRSILVVDDDRAIRDSLAVMLGEQGFPVQVYGSGQSCLDKCDLRTVACAIIDYRMPDMTGIELAARFRAVGFALPVILLTGAPPRDIEQLAAEVGVRAILTKPPATETLCALVKEAGAQSS